MASICVFNEYVCAENGGLLFVLESGKFLSTANHLSTILWVRKWTLIRSIASVGGISVISESTLGRKLVVLVGDKIQLVSEMGKEELASATPSH